MSVAMAAAAAARRLGVPRSHPFVGLSHRRRLPFFCCSRFPLQAVCYRTFLHKSFPVLQGRTRALLPVVVVNSSSSSAAALPETQQVSHQQQQQQQRGSAGIVSEVLEFTRRSHLCGTLGEEQVGERVCICGWVASQRSHGAVAFVNLRDHTGIVQVTTDPINFADAHKMAERLRIEYVVAVEGTVRLRPKEVVNARMATGFVEVVAESIQVLNQVHVALPFLVTTADDSKDVPTEEVRLRYRHLDLRRPQMNRNLRLRHSIIKLIRRYLEDVHDFIEIETPILTRSTPEGARDYLVPSRIQAGDFYALPQSPQLFKQMLMVSGFDRYYQLARCFRDEDLRADRQPEFTQLDMELSFTPLEDMLKLNEGLIRHVFKEIKGFELPNPFPRLTYAEAMAHFGSDKPDLRYGLKLVEVSDIFTGSSFAPFASSIVDGGIVKAISVTGGVTKISATRLKKGDVYQQALKSGAKSLPYLKVLEGGELEGPPAITGNLSMEQKQELAARCGASPGDVILFAAGLPRAVNRTLDAMRTYLAENLGFIDKELNVIMEAFSAIS
ncbi:hypothetical protein CY35_16G015900 [Sphagnum magellanicum]|nr:hypothetical protein CY35_16G015900 [Sphagnum magellanicum]